MTRFDPGIGARLRAAGFRGLVRPGAALAPLTTWRIGGPAELLAEPLDLDDLRIALAWAKDGGLPWRVLGNGSNLLVRDDGVRGLVLRVRRVLDEVAWDGPRILAGAGVSFPSLARQAAARGLAGLEFGGGIPGTLGGALVMNAGWHEFEIAASVCEVRWLHGDGKLQTLGGAECGFDYRKSRFRGGGGVVVGAELLLEPGDAAEIQVRMDRFAESRKLNQPTDQPSCGSVFLKPPGDFAGRLIEAAGLKGVRVGNIEVSPKHANFFVNLGGATAAEALELVERVERRVEAAFGVRLIREFELW